MRNYLVVSTVGHVAFLVGMAVLSLLIGEEAPAFETVSVSLTAVELPSREDSTPPPAPEPEVAPEVIPELPPAAPVETPDLEPERPADIPEPVIEHELVPPTPELPPEPKPVEEKITPPVEEFDLPEPDAVKPTPVEAPVESVEPQLEDPVTPALEAVPLDANTTLHSKSTEGITDYYYAVIKAKISRRWDPTRSSTRGSRESMAVISFKISASGAILDADITESSRLSVFDRQCLRAVLNASPLPAPPRSYVQAGSLPIEFVFTYQ